MKRLIMALCLGVVCFCIGYGACLIFIGTKTSDDGPVVVHTETLHIPDCTPELVRKGYACY